MFVCGVCYGYVVGVGFGIVCVGLGVYGVGDVCVVVDDG